MMNFFFFKQKTAYEMRISDWSSDVCSSDLPDDVARQDQADHLAGDQWHPQLGPVDAESLADRQQDDRQEALPDQLVAAGLEDAAGGHEKTGLEQIGRAACRESGGTYV